MGAGEQPAALSITFTGGGATYFHAENHARSGQVRPVGSWVGGQGARMILPRVVRPEDSDNSIAAATSVSG